MADEKKFPIEVEVSAKASLEVKAEIPPEATGAFLAALTDIIRPWSEKRGFKADQIRLQREDIAFEIAKKAQARLALMQSEPSPLSLKFLVPLLEKASLEDVDAGLREAWATLLASASRSQSARKVTFVDILSRLSSQELTLLERVCFAYERFPEREYPNGHIEQNLRSVKEHASLLEVDFINSGKALSVVNNFVSACRLVYGELVHLTIGTSDALYFYFNNRVPGMPQFEALEILKREGLIEFERVRFTESVEVAYFNVTTLGLDFVRYCSPLADEMAERRANGN